MTSASVAHSIQSIRPTSGAGRRPDRGAHCGPDLGRVAVDEHRRAARRCRMPDPQSVVSCAGLRRSYRRPAIGRDTPRTPAAATRGPWQDIMRGDLDRRCARLRVQQGALADATEHRQRRHHRLALERADVLRRPVRHVLHDPVGAPRRLADAPARRRARSSSTRSATRCRSRSSWWRPASPASGACSPPSGATSSGCAAGSSSRSSWA